LAALAFVGCGEESASSCATTETSASGEILETELLASVCEWEPGLSAEAVRGARIFVSAGCTTCHTYRGVGARNVGGSDLTEAGLRHGRRFFERFVEDPFRYGNDVMPKYAFHRPQLRQLALFLVASRGAH
jgi:cytochrome c peroxidase